jgi:hypothetical protein
MVIALHPLTLVRQRNVTSPYPHLCRYPLRLPLGPRLSLALRIAA